MVLTQLTGIEILAQELTLVLSAMVLVFWVAYSLMLYNQRQTGTVRHDWWISMVFYVGIALLVLGNLLLAFSQLYHAPEGQFISIILNVISMLVFVGAFYLRMQHALHPHNVLGEKPKPRPKARKRR